ncbi:acyltransferase family protein [Isoptericola aurantiacus]|uniref:acyltransferase family protein n=1 Tax=Isoptericola aurantiacus TaxID=3377839 RepID=UPI00383B4FB5
MDALSEPALRTSDGPSTPTAATGTRRSRLGRALPPHRRRIRGLDGLRALAVAAVIAYHVDPVAVPGGFLGVDVFFVVSGFLITTLLVGELRRTGRVRLGAFWARRARRLLPALAVVVLVSVLAARVVQPDLLVSIGRQVLGAATFTSNWTEIAAGRSYFESGAPVLFQPFWSLAVEEQFYLAWPVLLLVLLAVVPTVRGVGVLALAGAAASAVAMAVLFVPTADPTRVYYGTGTHLFGLLLGAAAALLHVSRGRLLPPRVSRWAPAAATAGLLALFCTLHSDSPWTYRGGILLGSLLALVLVSRCADVTDRAAPTWGVRLLELRPVVWVGERSYGLYLWHWPVLLLVGAVVAAQPGTVAWWRGTAAALGITVALAAASYRWVETPVRHQGFRATAARLGGSMRSVAPHPVVARSALAACCVVALAAGVVVVTAPRVSQAQLAVEQGAAVLAAQAADGDGAADGAGPAAGSNAATGEKAATRDGGGGTATGEKAATRDGGGGVTAKDEKDGRQGGGTKDAATGTDEDGDGRGDPAQKEGSGAVAGPEISAFGDSVLSGAAPAVLEALPGIAIDAEPIRKWLDVPELVRRSERAGELRDVVVLQFGTNGGFQFAGSEDALDETLDIIGPDRQVVLVTSVGVSYWVPDANAQLHDVAADRDNVVVAEWADAVRGRTGLLHADRTHPNMAGIVVYADVLSTALAGLG